MSKFDFRAILGLNKNKWLKNWIDRSLADRILVAAQIDKDLYLTNNYTMLELKGVNLYDNFSGDIKIDRIRRSYVVEKDDNSKYVEAIKSLKTNLATMEVVATFSTDITSFTRANAMHMVCSIYKYYDYIFDGGCVAEITLAMKHYSGGNAVFTIYKNGVLKIEAKDINAYIGMIENDEIIDKIVGGKNAKNS